MRSYVNIAKNNIKLKQIKQFTVFDQQLTVFTKSINAKQKIVSRRIEGLS